MKIKIGKNGKIEKIQPKINFSMPRPGPESYGYDKTSQLEMKYGYLSSSYRGACSRCNKICNSYEKRQCPHYLRTH